MFLIHTVDGGHVPPYEYLPAAAITPKIGMAMAPNASGQLAVAGGTTAPKYICMQEKEAAVAAGDKVQLVGFGNFDVRERAEREGRNPQKPEETIKIPSTKVPVFKAGRILKDAVK